MRTDFSSMAYSLMPAAIGLMGGGPVGALAGFGKGMEDVEANRVNAEKYNQAMALKQREIAMQEQRSAMLNREAEANMEKIALERQRLEMILGDGKTIRERLSPEDLNLYQTYGKEKFTEYKLEGEKLAGAGRFLTAHGLPKGLNADQAARTLGPKGISEFVQQSQTSAREARNPWILTGDGRSMFNRHTGEVKPLDDPQDGEGDI